jgi:hypothetical protein
MARIKKTIIPAVAAFIIIVFSRLPSAMPPARILVLGFDSAQLNDIQDRLLRETILRGFHDRGCSIVPVMEIESLFYGSRVRQIRKLDRDTVRSICKDFQAGFACYGSIVPEDNRKDDCIRPGKNYICAITFYRKAGDAFYEMKFTSTGRDSLDQFFQSVSESVVSGTIKLL